MWPYSFDRHQRYWTPELSVAGPPLLGSPQSVGSCRPHRLQNGLMQNLQALISGNWQDFHLVLMTPALPLLQVASVVALIWERCKRSWPRHYFSPSCSRKAPPSLTSLLSSSSLHILFKLSCRKPRALASSASKVAKFTPYSTMPANKYWGQYWPLWYLGAAYCRLSNLALLRPALLMHCLLTIAATSQIASLRRLRFLAFDVAVILPGKKPLWLLAASRRRYIVHLQLSLTALLISRWPKDSGQWHTSTVIAKGASFFHIAFRVNLC